MNTIRETGFKKKNRPIKVVQFGEGNFLRAFADYMIDIANDKSDFNGSIAIVKAIRQGSLERFERQNGLYTVVLRGKQDHKVINSSRIISSVSTAVGCYENFEEYLKLAHLETLRFVISNTTEAGIVLDENDRCNPIPESYPGKLTQFLYERYQAFGGAEDKGLIILPVELIENNGGKLKECVLALSKIWQLPQDFIAWLNHACVFCSTLVDRIVTGYPADEATEICNDLGYSDELLDVAEPFGLWVIESDRDISKELPFAEIGLPVVFTNNQKPYRERKVRILNGAHTSTVLLGWLAGLEFVRQCMEDGTVREFMEKAVNEEIKPFVKLPADDVNAFADAVFERFENPFIKHKVLDISLNSVSKWKTRILPSFKDYYKEYGELPRTLTFSFAALLQFYTADSFDGEILLSKREDGREYQIRDDKKVLEYIFAHSSKTTEEYVQAVAKNTDFWGEDLSEYKDFCARVCAYLDAIRNHGARTAAQEFLSGELT